MRQTLTAIAILCLIVAQPILSSSSVHDARSTEILKKVSKTYKAYKTIKASFTIDVKNSSTNKSIKQKGTLYLKGKKFRIDMAGQEIYCDGKTIWTYLKDANEVQITNYDEKNMDISPSSIFKIYEKGFLHKFSGEVTEKSKTMSIIEMTPTDKNKAYFKVQMYINKVGNKIEKMIVNSKNGMTTTYSITKFAGNIKINNSFFKFDSKLKPGVIEVDLR